MAKGSEFFSPATWMQMGRDRQFLYLRFLCYEDDMSSLSESVTQNDDGNIWTDDSLELFFYPNENDLQNGFQLIVSSKGVLFDKTCTGTLSGDIGWSSDATVRITKEPNRWIAEIRVPFANIGIGDPNFAGNLTANFYRNRTRDSQHTSSCWSATGQGYHNCPKDFGLLILH